MNSTKLFQSGLLRVCPAKDLLEMCVGRVEGLGQGLPDLSLQRKIQQVCFTLPLR